MTWYGENMFSNDTQQVGYLGTARDVICVEKQGQKHITSYLFK